MLLYSYDYVSVNIKDLLAWYVGSTTLDPELF